MQTIKNFVHLIGHVGNDIQLRAFESGRKKATFSLATSDSYKDSNNEYITNTQWHNLVAWGKTAELISTLISKGDQLVIKGSINYRSYQNKDGNTRYITEILIESFYKTHKKSDAHAPGSEAVAVT